jgi:hypothetical protein
MNIRGDEDLVRIIMIGKWVKIIDPHLLIPQG